MNDQRQPDPGTGPQTGPQTGPETDAHIRALLAELGSGPAGETMPPEVAGRLEDTLARLVAERGPERGTATGKTDEATVLPLRRRWLPRAAAAAAAVIVVGLGGVTAANLGVFGGGSSDSASSSDAGGAAAPSERKSRPESAAEPTPAQPRDTKAGADSSPGRALDATELPSVSAARFASDVSTLLGQQGAVRTPEQQRAHGTNQPPVNGLLAGACPGPVIIDGSVPTPVRYDGRLAVLVVHPAQDQRRLVETWNCAGDRQLAETTLTP